MFLSDIDMVKTNYLETMEGGKRKKDANTFKFIYIFQGCSKEPFTNHNHFEQQLR